MKKSAHFVSLSSILFTAIALCTLSSCVETFTPKMEIDAESAKSSYLNALQISPMDDSVKVEKGKITIAPKEEDSVYIISGYFKGQIKINTKNTVLKLANAYLENDSGKPAILAKAKAEISSMKDSENYIVSRGRSFAKKGAVEAERGLVLGGSGTILIKGEVCHAVEAEDVKIKGSGVFYLEGTKRGSALTCETLEVEKDKTFSAFFLNAKNGIKADQTISIASGNFHLYSNDTALKTDTARDSPKKPHGITLSGGKFYLAENANFAQTDENAFDASGAEIATES